MHTRWNNFLITLGLIASVALSWSELLDEQAQQHTQQTLKRALITYAVTRSLNGVISVAQGTELALQPAGIGVTLTPGEILDPLNDLVERFSWLTLMASTSLGTQLLMAEVFASKGIDVVFTGILLGLTLIIWQRRKPRWRERAARLALVLVILRFSFALVALLSSLFGETFLLQKEEQSMQFLTQTEHLIESTQLQPLSPQPDESLLDRFSSFMDEQKQALDMEARLQRLSSHIETASEHLINLMVIFLVQTVLIPLAVLFLIIGAIRLSWRRLTP